MLSDGFCGVKTGTTKNAGPCLCACFDEFVVVLLNCSTLDLRWVEAKKIADWAVLNENESYMYKFSFVYLGGPTTFQKLSTLRRE